MGWGAQWGAETHGDDQVVLDVQLVAQRQDEALAVLLALADQEHAAARTRGHHGNGGLASPHGHVGQEQPRD